MLKNAFLIQIVCSDEDVGKLVGVARGGAPIIPDGLGDAAISIDVNGRPGNAKRQS
jgi:hypothetical protein